MQDGLCQSNIAHSCTKSNENIKEKHETTPPVVCGVVSCAVPSLRAVGARRACCSSSLKTIILFPPCASVSSPPLRSRNVLVRRDAFDATPPARYRTPIVTPTSEGSSANAPLCPDTA